MSEERDPVRAAAILKLSQQLQKKKTKAFKSIYRDILKDLGVTPKQVDDYIEANREELVELCRDKGLTK